MTKVILLSNIYLNFVPFESSGSKLESPITSDSIFGALSNLSIKHAFKINKVNGNSLLLKILFYIFHTVSYKHDRIYLDNLI